MAEADIDEDEDRNPQEFEEDLSNTVGDAGDKGDCGAGGRSR